MNLFPYSCFLCLSVLAFPTKITRKTQPFLHIILTSSILAASSLSYHPIFHCFSLLATMVCATQSMISANTCAFLSHKFLKPTQGGRPNSILFRVRASSTPEDDCNEEECAPDKEVGKLSMEWLAGDNTKVAGTYPPKKKGWTGYVEKDTAGQTNIYSVEPAVYVAESVISSGTAGSSKDGAENTAAIAAGLALISVAAASSILLQVGKNSPPAQNTVYSGPTLSYYINKFTPPEIVEASISIPSEDSPSVQLENSSTESSPDQLEPEKQTETTAVPDLGNVSQESQELAAPDLGNVSQESQELAETLGV